MLKFYAESTYKHLESDFGPIWNNQKSPVTKSFSSLNFLNAKFHFLSFELQTQKKIRMDFYIFSWPSTWKQMSVDLHGLSPWCNRWWCHFKLFLRKQFQVESALWSHPDCNDWKLYQQPVTASPFPRLCLWAPPHARTNVHGLRQSSGDFQTQTFQSLLRSVSIAYLRMSDGNPAKFSRWVRTKLLAMKKSFKHKNVEARSLFIRKYW